MRNISDKGIIRITFLFSLLAHCLFLSVSGLNLNIPQAQKRKDITVKIKIEKPPLLPKIDVMGKEKKLRKIAKEKELPEPKSQIEEVAIKKTPKELIKEKVKVINPSKKAMLRYQDMVKQKIESCRRYPNWAKKQGFEGVSYLTFTVLSSGMIQDVKIIHSSGFAILDNEAVSTIKRANPFLPIPKDTNASFIQMEVSLVFSLQ